MTIPFWMHCNVCSDPFTKQSKLFMLNCFHTVCKNCLKCNPDGAAVCPFCKKNVKMMDITKMSNELKDFFRPNIENSIQKSLKMIHFQRTQQTNIFKHARNAKIKYKKIGQVAAKLEQELHQLKQKNKDMVERRKMMQAKLMEINRKNRQKNEVQYRNPINHTPSSVSHISRYTSSNFSHLNEHNMSHLATNPSNYSSFFNKDAPMFSQHNSSIPSEHSSRSRHSQITYSNQSSQSNRKPFFA